MAMMNNFCFKSYQTDAHHFIRFDEHCCWNGYETTCSKMPLKLNEIDGKMVEEFK